MRKYGYTYSVMMKELAALCSEYEFLTFSTLGRSLVGREIPLISLGSGRGGILYVGTHHGMEWITSMLLVRYLRDACMLIASGNGEKILSGKKIYIVPMLNPDGVELQALGYDKMNPMTLRLHRMSGGDYSKWQANGRGVDLNHNYDAGFEEYKILERENGILGGCATKFSGEYPESEPETSCLCSFIRSTDISLLIALHTQGEEIYYDYNGHIPLLSRKIAKRMEAISGYKLSTPEGSACYGGLKDWFIKEYDKPAFTIECGKGENPLPHSDCDKIYSRIKDILLLCPSFI